MQLGGASFETGVAEQALTVAQLGGSKKSENKNLAVANALYYQVIYAPSAYHSLPGILSVALQVIIFHNW